MGSAEHTVTGRSLLSRVGERTNMSPANNASWIVAVGILAVVIPASDKVAANQVFFAAHGVSPFAWVGLLVVVVVGAWLVLVGLLSLLRRFASSRNYDAVTSLVMLIVTWFLVGNVLSRTILSGAQMFGPIAGFVVAALLTLLTRRLAMGTILVVFAAIAAAVPLVTSVATASTPTTAGAFVFDEQGDRPSVLWIISDELQYPLVFDQQGNVRDEFPNLKALASQSTTYTKGYSAANYTDYAVPSMLNGITDVAAQGADRMQQVRAGIGIVPGLSSDYSVVMESPIYSFDCDTEECASVGSSDEVGIVQRYWDFAKDTAAIAGRTTLADPFSGLFPSLDGKWRDFWSGGDEFGDNAEGRTVETVIAGIDQVTTANPSVPFFALWHTIRTHAPWNVDRDGTAMYPSRVPIVEGAHMIGAEADQTYTTEELKRLERRLYANAAVDFDRQLGELMGDLKATGRFDNTMIVVTADHGATMTEKADRRVGDDLVQRWSEVAHVPLVVKAPGQTEPELVTTPKSTGQIAATVLETAGATIPADSDLAENLSPDLSADVPGGPVFTTIAGGVMTPWRYDGITEVDPWLPEDLTPPDPQHPFAIGVDPGLLGAPVPDGWTQVSGARVQILPGESDQEVVIVDRAPSQCPTDVTTGLVAADGTVVGSVLWEGPSGSQNGQTRGWAIVPASDPVGYSFWCPSS